MKLKKLYIENIASIAQAEINFDAAPLSDERLFLISGETGAGKSTIIDCICLALYGKTPRLKDKSRSSYAVGQDVELSIFDPRQLLRRGAGEANIKLTFDDRNGVPYVASWHVHRKHNNPNDKYTNVVRTLETDEGVTPHMFYKNTNIEDPIKEIVGLDMDQFFRTVVLAQGKFAEFIESEDKEKAMLLEKMTGTEIYSRIGSKIYDMCETKKNAYEILKGQLQGITLLDDDEKANINAELEQRGKDLQEAQSLVEKAKEMDRWLNDKAQNAKDLSDKQAELSKQQARAHEQDFIDKQQLVKDWDATSNARHEMDAKHKAEAEVERLEKEKDGMQSDFDKLCSALRAVQIDTEAKQRELADTQAFINQEEPNKPIYEELGKIKVWLQDRKTAKNNISEYSDALERDNANLPKREQAVKEAKDAQVQTEAVVTKVRTEYEALNIDQVNSAKDNLNQSRIALNDLKAKNDLVAESQQSIAKLLEDQKEAQAELDKEKAAIEGKREVLRQAIDAVDRQSDWNALLDQAHKTLHKGDMCPVCGNVIKDLLETKGENELAVLRQKKTDAEDVVRQAEASIAANNKRLTDAGLKCQDEEKNLKSKTEDRDRTWAKAQVALAQCGITETDLPDNARIEELTAKIGNEIDAKTKIQTKANDLFNQLQDAIGKNDKAKDKYNAALQVRDKVQQSIEAQKHAIEESNIKVADLTGKLDALLGDKDWQQNEDGFIDELERAAKVYNEKVKAENILSQAVDRQRDSIQRIQQYKAGIHGFKDNNLPACETVPGDLESRWNAMENKTVRWTADLENQRRTIAQAKQALDDFFAQNASIDIARLKAIASHGQAEIEGIREVQRRLLDSIIGLKSTVETLAQQQRAMADKKPDFDEEDKEKLSEIINANQIKTNDLNAQISELNACLKQDADNQEKVGKLSSECEAAKQVYQNWSNMNNMLGSASGDQFRKIAQSYILGDLLGSANGYLRKFNGRYELETNPGSLTILARDMQQGDTTSVATLSGGEKFMASLALALALSNMSGKVFSVDTIFIDEGFGSLSSEYLDNVMQTLNRLYDMGGRRVGIISHVEALKERVPTQIKVARDAQDNTVSRIEVV